MLECLCCVVDRPPPHDIAGSAELARSIEGKRPPQADLVCVSACRSVESQRRGHCNNIAMGTASAAARRVAPFTYILPLRAAAEPTEEFVAYVNALGASTAVVIVDGSAERVYRALAARLAPSIVHVPPDRRFAHLDNGKVQGVLTGLQLATHDIVVVADDDVRYEAAGLDQVVEALRDGDVVRPQNYFEPLPWHAMLDTGRTLINRVTGGDWPGTLAFRRSALTRSGGYDGNVLFENLELVRTIVAGGGTALTRPDLMVRRLPPRTSHFWSQRVRQAYDEFARPGRLMLQLAILPAATLFAFSGSWWMLATFLIAAPIAVAEFGRRVHDGQRVFPFAAALFAPAWVIERACCSWMAVGMRLVLGGVPYHGRIMRKAANPTRALRRESLVAETTPSR
jgi:hypothetical protein